MPKRGKLDACRDLNGSVARQLDRGAIEHMRANGGRFLEPIRPIGPHVHGVEIGRPIRQHARRAIKDQTRDLARLFV